MSDASGYPLRILILTLGSRGDVQPYVALGRELRERGHEVTLSTGRGFEAMIEAEGLRAAPLRVDVRTLVQSPQIQEAMRTFRGKVKAWRASKAMLRQELDDMWQVAQAERPEVIVYHPKAFVAPYLAQALGATAIPSFLQPGYVPTGAFLYAPRTGSSIGYPLNKLINLGIARFIRAVLATTLRDWFSRQPAFAAAPPCDILGGYAPSGSPVPRLHAFSGHLVPRPADWSAREHVTGYWFMDRAATWTPPPALEQFLASGPPPVYVGFGSMPSEDAAAMTRLVSEALTQAGQRGILAKGWGGLQIDGFSERLFMLETAAHDWLFPRCAAVVHHGGAGTTHEALRWGRPSVVCPVFADQPFWGRRVQAVGAGPAPLPQKHLSADRLAAAIVAAQQPETVAAAAEVGARIRAENGTQTAATLVEATMRQVS